MAIEDQLAEILAKLEEMSALWNRPTQRRAPSLSPSASLPVTTDDDHEVDATTDGKPATPISSSSATSASLSFSSSETAGGGASVTIDEYEVTVSTNGKLVATSPAALMSSSTSDLPQDAVRATSPPPDVVLNNPAAASTLSVMELTRCSTPGLYQVADFPAAATTLSPSPSPSSTSSSTPMSGETSSDVPLVTRERPQVSPAKCSTLGPSHDAHDPVLVAASTSSPSKPVASIPALPSPALSPALSITATTVTNLFAKASSCMFNLDMMLQPAWPPPIQLEVEKVGIQLGAKPPWLLCTGVCSSWSEKIQLVNGFLLETTPWMVCSELIFSTCRTYVLGMLLKNLWPLPAKVRLIGDGFLLVAVITTNSIVLLKQWRLEGLLPTWGCSMFSALIHSQMVLISPWYALPEYAARKNLGVECGLIQHLIVSLRQDQGEAFLANSGVVVFQLLHADELFQFLQGGELQYDLHSIFSRKQITRLSQLGGGIHEVSAQCTTHVLRIQLKISWSLPALMCSIEDGIPWVVVLEKKSIVFQCYRGGVKVLMFSRELSGPNSSYSVLLRSS